MSRPGLNAASRPFLNTRPIRRVATALWIRGRPAGARQRLALLARLDRGRARGRPSSSRSRPRSRERRERQKNLEKAFQGMDLDQLNARIVFLNGKLTERSFGWSDLFERLTEVVPNDVRLHSLNPRFTFEDTGELDNVFRGDRVGLIIRGAAKNDEVILEFVDALFQHESFERPSLQNETILDRGETNFDLGVIYLPEARAAVEEAAEEAVQASDGDAPEDAAVAADSPDAQPESEEAS